MPLTDIPNEILLLIVESISPQSLKSIYALIQTNRRFAALLIPYLQNLATTDEYIFNALLWAAATRNEPIIRFLVEGGAGSTVTKMYLRRPSQEREPIVQDARSNEDLVRLVVEEGPNIIFTVKMAWDSSWKATPISYAVIMGYPTLSMLLLENGANVEVGHLTHCAYGHRGVAAKVIRKIIEVVGIDGQLMGPVGKTPLYHAVRAREHTLVRVLLECGVNADEEFAVMVNSKRPLFPLQIDPGFFTVERYEMIRTMLSYNSTVLVDQRGNTGLHLAASTEDRELARILLSKGNKVDAREYQRKTPLHFAASSGSAMVSLLLLENGANMNARDLHGKTPLHWAAKFGHSRVMRILIDAGAHKDARDYVGNTPLHLATRYKHTGAFRLLLWKNVALGIADNRGNTALHIAAKWGDAVMIKALLGKGSDFTTRNYSEQTPLLLAAKYGHVFAVRILLENGATIADRDARGRGMPEWVMDEVLNHPDRCIMGMPNISLVNRLRREKDNGRMYTIAKDFWRSRSFWGL